MAEYEIGIDMGGTHTAVGLVKDNEIVDKIEFKTDVSNGVNGYATGLALKVNELLTVNRLSKKDVISAGMGVPGSANRNTGMVEYANNIGFENIPFQDMLSKELGMPVLLDNDANLAALGEYLMSKSTAKRYVFVTIGTGIGCGIILNGEIYRGVNFAEGEVGHMTIKYDGIECNCGRRGCFEAYASANALVKMACDAMTSNRSSALWNYTKIDGKAVFEAAETGDRTVLKVLDEYTTLLAEGFANIINILQPDELVIGGGISGAADDFMPATVEKTGKLIYSRRSWKNTVIKTASFTNDAGIYGAAKLR